jgi:hypothetical protein
MATMFLDDGAQDALCHEKLASGFCQTDKFRCELAHSPLHDLNAGRCGRFVIGASSREITQRQRETECIRSRPHLIRHKPMAADIGAIRRAERHV